MMAQFKKIFITAFLLATGIALVQAPHPAWGAPPAYMDKAESTPDMGQRDGIGFLPLNGNGYCAPVAVSNSLIWLDKNGFPGIVACTGDQFMSQLRLAALLGEARYMNTDTDIGTGPNMVMKGVAVYLMERGYSDATMEYQGWRQHPEVFSTGVEVPDLDWIKEGLVGASAVWLNVGMYKYDSATAVYGRVGGHWVTLAGYGVDESGAPQPDTLLIHDPALRKSRTGQNGRYVKVQKIVGGGPGPEPTLGVETAGYFDKVAGEAEDAGGDSVAQGAEPGLPRSAIGFYKLGGQMRVPKKADFAILDGAVVLRLKDSSRPRRR